MHRVNQTFQNISITIALVSLSFTAVAAPIGGGGGIRATVAGAAARQQTAATTAPSTETGPIAAPATTQPAAVPDTGFYEFVAGVGFAQVKVGKSQLGISATESDLVSQQNNSYHSYMGHVGIGYHYYLGEPDRFSTKFIWFPSIEPIVNLYYHDLKPKGNVYLFNNPGLGTSTFDMPIHTTSLMIDLLLNIFTVNHFSYFILGGVGEGWSKISYHDAPDSTGALTRPRLDLKSRSQSNAMYEWGTGISYAFNPRIKVAFEYLYTHIGNIRTSGNGTLGGVPVAVDPAGFSLRTQMFALDLYATFC